MIIYASMGLGKTTYCKNHPNCFDANYYHFLHSDFRSYRDFVLDKNAKYDKVFINYIEDLDIDMIDQVYIAENYDMIKNRVDSRSHKYNVDLNRFMLEQILFPNAIIVKENQYLSDFMD